MECVQSELGVFQCAEVEERESAVSTPQHTQRVHVALAHLGLEVTDAGLMRQRADVDAAAELRHLTPTTRTAAAAPPTSNAVLLTGGITRTGLAVLRRRRVLVDDPASSLPQSTPSPALSSVTSFMSHASLIIQDYDGCAHA